MRFHAEVPVIPFLRLMHHRLALAILVLCRKGVRQTRWHLTMVPPHIIEPFFADFCTACLEKQSRYRRIGYGLMAQLSHFHLPRGNTSLCRFNSERHPLSGPANSSMQYAEPPSRKEPFHYRFLYVDTARWVFLHCTD
jgi:hypothetical protein